MIYERALLIGRFEPLHIAHVRQIHYGLAISNRLVIALGSCQKQEDNEFLKRNPFSAEERKYMIREAIGKSECKKIDFVETEDKETDSKWYCHIIDVTWDYIGVKSLILLGGNKDEYYIDSLSKYLGCIKSDFSFNDISLHASYIRKLYFDGKYYQNLVPYAIAEYLEFIKHTNKDWFLKMKELYHDDSISTK